MSITRDERYLRTEQYRTDEKLRARIDLHTRFSVNREGWFRWLYREAAPHLVGRVLDLGCGNARLWASNADRPAPRSLVLCDLSAGMLDEARRALAACRVRPRFAQASAMALPFASERFDTVLANHMLYHVSALPRALAEIRRVLIPGGRLVASTNGPRALREIDDLLREVRPSLEPNPHVELGAIRERVAERIRREDSFRVTIDTGYLTATRPGSSAGGA